MEHRFLHQREFGEYAWRGVDASGKAFGHLPELSNPRNSRLALGNRIEQNQINKAVRLAQNPRKLEEKLDDAFSDRFLGKLRAASERQSPLLNAARTPMMAALEKQPQETQDRVAGMFDALTQIPGPEAVRDGSAHPYLSSQEQQSEQGDPWHFYEVNFDKIAADRALLQQLKNAHPEQAKAIAMLDSSLENFARQDRRFALHEWQQSRKENYTDQTIGKMGKMTVFIIAASAAVITGIMALANRKFSAAPLLYAAVAGLIASPKLRRAIFQSEHQAVLEDVDNVLNNKQFIEKTKRFSIEGDAWATAAEAIMDPAHSETNALLQLLEQHPASRDPIEADINTYVTTLSPDSTVQSALKTMIMNGEFPAFVNQIRHTSKKDAQEVILDYIRRGAGRYRKDVKTVQNTEEAIKKTTVVQMSETPGGTLPA